MTKALIVDCLGRGSGKRLSTVDVIGVGPRSIAGVLEKHKVYVNVKPFEEYIKILRKIKEYDILLISAMSQDIGAVEKAIDLWKEKAKGPVILGGPIVFGIKHIRHLRFDIAVYGEGEATLNELLENGLKEGTIPSPEVLSKIKGIVFRVGKKTLFTGAREFLPRNMLNTYKPSTRVVKDYPQYWAYRVYVEVLRGCSNFYRPLIKLSAEVKCANCNLCFEGPLEKRLKCPYNIPPGCGYCSVPALYGPTRSRNVDVIVEEIKELIRLGVTRITLSASDILDYGRDWLVEPKPLTDPHNPPANIDALRSLFEKIFSISEVSAGEVTVLLENIRANLVNDKVAKLLSEYFKNTPIHMGCETGSDSHAKLIGRPALPSNVLKATKILIKYGLKPYIYFIHGLPGQNSETVKKTVKMIREFGKLGVEKITTYRFTPLPGTAFENFPPGTPITKDKLSRAIVNTANEVNMMRKEKLVGKIVEAIVVNKYHKDKRFNVAYPLPHGPVILIKNADKYYGFRVKVKIVKVASERTVLGRIVSVVRRVKPLSF